MNREKDKFDSIANAVVEGGSGIDASRQDVVRVLKTVLGLAVEMMNADKGIILLEDENSLQPVAAYNISTDDEDLSHTLSSSVVQKVFGSGASLLTHDAQTDPRFEGSSSVIMHQITSIICVPMYVDNKVIGVIYLDSRRNRQRFTEENLSFIETFARMAAIAYDYAKGYKYLYDENLRLRIESINEFQLLNRKIIGQSKKMQEVFALIRRVMNSDISVLLEGESGTGKELVARALHYIGPRREKPFVVQFCGNLSETLLESELFGHKKGSFTGAISDKRGLFEMADGGTFFLDEIADISPTIQAKLLRVIQEGEIRRVGSTESRIVDVRIISATNKDLKKEADEKRFREDLFYRLNVITVKLPPLRERTGDVPLLVKHFLDKFSESNDIKLKRISARAMQALENYAWPGNIRELENTIERAMVLSEGEKIGVEDLFIPEAESLAGGRKTLKDYEKDIVTKTLEECNNNKTRTADILGVSLRWLHYKLNEWKNKVD